MMPTTYQPMARNGTRAKTLCTEIVTDFAES
jgi:hypothetical protein